MNEFRDPIFQVQPTPLTQIFKYPTPLWRKKVPSSRDTLQIGTLHWKRGFRHETLVGQMLYLGHRAYCLIAANTTMIIQLNYIVTFDLSTICHLRVSDLLQFSCDDDLILCVQTANKELPGFHPLLYYLWSHKNTNKNITSKILSHQTIHKKQLYPEQLAFIRAECIQLQP